MRPSPEALENTSTRHLGQQAGPASGQPVTLLLPLDGVLREREHTVRCTPTEPSNLPRCQLRTPCTYPCSFQTLAGVGLPSGVQANHDCLPFRSPLHGATFTPYVVGTGFDGHRSCFPACWIQGVQNGSVSYGADPPDTDMVVIGLFDVFLLVMDRRFSIHLAIDKPCHSRTRQSNFSKQHRMRFKLPSIHK